MFEQEGIIDKAINIIGYKGELNFSDGEHIPLVDYEWDGRHCITPLKSLTHSVSYQMLEELQLVNGQRTIKHEGKTYRIRLMENDEWDEVYGKLKENGMSDENLNCRPEKGGAVWVYHPDYVESNFSVYRGRYGVSRLFYDSSSGTGSNYGWRPVFEEKMENQIMTDDETHHLTKNVANADRLKESVGQLRQSIHKTFQSAQEKTEDANFYKPFNLNKKELTCGTLVNLADILWPRSQVLNLFGLRGNEPTDMVIVAPEGCEWKLAIITQRGFLENEIRVVDAPSIPDATDSTDEFNLIIEDWIKASNQSSQMGWV